MTFKGECKIYKSKYYGNGYPLKYNKVLKKTRYAHRILWEETYGEVPKKKVVMHLCDNRLCVNLEHLRLGTQMENVHDMHSKGRWCDRKGEKHPLAKIKNTDIQRIKDKYKAGITQIKIAKEFGVCQSSISKITNGTRRNYAII